MCWRRCSSFFPYLTCQFSHDRFIWVFFSRCTSFCLQPTEMCGWSGETASSRRRKQAARPPTNLGTSSSPGFWRDLSSSRTRAARRDPRPEASWGGAGAATRSPKNPGRIWLHSISRKRGKKRVKLGKEGGRKKEQDRLKHPDSFLKS